MEDKMRTVLLSMHPLRSSLVSHGFTTIDLRKTKPQLEPPFKCYVYQTMLKYGYWNEKDGKVVGEFVCDSIEKYDQLTDELARMVCMTQQELLDYASPKGYLYGLHVSSFIEYKIPMLLHHFGIRHPPVSWQYLKAQPNDR